jgi:hypothetical protein
MASLGVDRGRRVPAACAPRPAPVGRRPAGRFGPSLPHRKPVERRHRRRTECSVTKTSGQEAPAPWIGTRQRGGRRSPRTAFDHPTSSGHTRPLHVGPPHGRPEHRDHRPRRPR